MLNQLRKDNKACPAGPGPGPAHNQAAAAVLPPRWKPTPSLTPRGLIAHLRFHANPELRFSADPPIPAKSFRQVLTACGSAGGGNRRWCPPAGTSSVIPCKIREGRLGADRAAALLNNLTVPLKLHHTALFRYTSVPCIQAQASFRQVGRAGRTQME